MSNRQSAIFVGSQRLTPKAIICSHYVSWNHYVSTSQLWNSGLKKKQNQQFTDFAFLTIFYCREICKWTSTCNELTESQLRWLSNLFGGTPPIPPLFLKGWVAPLKPKSKQRLTTSFRWPSHDVTRGAGIPSHWEFHSSWTSCKIWVAFEKHLSRYLCNFKATVNSIFCCVLSISIVSVKATFVLQFE